ncbi:MAG TPA: hypothetical protein VLR71_05065 [Casimicrobiaceae bacterium]|nr:hypothetical protein [Casimicrobiaceae bacterium]
MTSAQPDLDARLAALRDEAARFEPPIATDAAVAAAVRAAARRRPAGRHAWIAWPLAIAASVVIVSFVLRSLGMTPDDARSAVVPPRHAAFTPVVPLAELQANEEAVVVPARVPRMTLAQFGVPIDPARADDTVDTELLVRRDGSLLAYRFVTY